MKARITATGFAVAGLALSAMLPSVAAAADSLEALGANPNNWTMQTGDYTGQHYSRLSQITTGNVKNLKAAWSFSTGLLHGHEGAPLVIGDMMYINTPFPNNTFALNLAEPEKIVWQHKPKQDASVKAVACCDIVNRGLAYDDGRIFKTQLDGHLVALDAKTGKELWKMENCDPAVGSTITQAPFAVKGKVLVGCSGAELGVRGYVTAYDQKTGELVWRSFATGPDNELNLSKDFNKDNPHYGQMGLGTKTWEGEAWKIGGGTNWGWYAYDPKLNLFYYGSGNPAPWNETMRPGDNKWTMTIWARDVDTGAAKWGYQKTPHDEWDFAGVNQMILTDQAVNGKSQPLLTHVDRNGIMYTLNRQTGSIVQAAKVDPAVNVFKKVDLKTGLPLRDPEFSTRMDHKGTNICPSAMGFHNQGLDAYDPDSRTFYFGLNHICMDWEPFMLPYRAGQFFVGATLAMYPGPNGPTKKEMGQVRAMDGVTGEVKWTKWEKFSVWGGTLATKGGLVFYNTLDGNIKALDKTNGKEIWKFKMPSGAIGAPMSYAYKGKQYIATNYGVGGWPGVGLVFDLTDPSAGLGAVGAFKELQSYTQMGGGVMVFGL
ncbi:methanol/ethanol family PQQ-dependent dehydrogenase [Methylovorus menthalis]|jgi:methanol dehydrogenase (cytochrome c) subunit 1|nr:methanol/ethanol family PQQ-dependent dehydrogenase [Methylovorus menthalis]